jgi:hypothetical protein
LTGSRLRRSVGAARGARRWPRGSTRLFLSPGHRPRGGKVLGCGDLTKGFARIRCDTLRSPFSLEKLRYQGKTGTIIYQSRMHPVLKRNFEVFSATDWLAALTAHIPNAGEHLVRDYGWYSKVSRGKRRKTQEEDPSQRPSAPGCGARLSVSKPHQASLRGRSLRLPTLCGRHADHHHSAENSSGSVETLATKPSSSSPRWSRRFSPTWGCGRPPRIAHPGRGTRCGLLGNGCCGVIRVRSVRSREAGAGSGAADGFAVRPAPRPRRPSCVVHLAP